MFSEADIRRFEGGFVRGSADDCWEWRGESNHHGHGRVWAASRKMLASHVALILAGHPRPSRLLALHSCDNPPFVNPAHLRWGTQAENVKDRHSRGRDARMIGAANPSAKLNAEKVLSIRADQRGLRAISEDFGVSPQCVWSIKKRKSWAHV